MRKQVVNTATLRHFVPPPLEKGGFALDQTNRVEYADQAYAGVGDNRQPQRRYTERSKDDDQRLDDQ